ncbi:RDD family protein [Thiosocius teredinicola]|uniref:RDD family protein n=1 Tax=Thiosocius teredinicola TaxID=1973002 RepID=UPI000990DD4B
MQLLDTVHTFETPEGVDLSLRVAGPVPRALAVTLDAIIRYSVLFGISLAVMPFADLGVGALLIAMFFMEWLYPVFFEVMRGATPGKKAFGLLVVHDNGTPIGWPASMIRNLLRVVDFLPLLYTVGLVTMVVNKRFQRLGDLAAGTLVVYTESSKPVINNGDTSARSLPVLLPVEDQRAILDFAERSAALSPARVQELAEILSDTQGEAAVKQVLGHARWLVSGS